MELVAGVASWVWGSWLFLGSWLKLGHFSEEQLQQRSPGNYGVDWRSPGCRSGQGTWELEKAPGTWEDAPAWLEEQWRSRHHPGVLGVVNSGEHCGCMS